MHGGDLHTHVLGCDLLDILDEGFADGAVVLIGDKSAGDLSVGLGGQDGLCSLALVTTPDPTDIEARTTAITLEGVVAHFAEEVIYVEELLVLLFAEWDLGDHRTLFVREGHDVVVEVWDGDAPVLVLYLCDELTELVDGVRHGTTEVP